MNGWLTQDTIPGRVNVCISLPDSESWRAQFLGAILELTKSENWEKHGSLTILDMSDEWRAVFFDFVDGGCSMLPVGTILPFGGDTAPTGFFMCDGAPFVRADFSDLYAIIGVTYGVGNGTTTANLPNLRGRVPVGKDPSQTEFDALGEVGGEKSHTLTTPELASHNHTQNTHGHTQPAHNHAGGYHSHEATDHNHSQNGHAHGHIYSGGGALATHGATYTAVGQVIGGGMVQSAVATNNPANVPIGFTTPENGPATATNETTVATNQSAGSGSPHENMPPFLVVNYIIKF